MSVFFIYQEYTDDGCSIWACSDCGKIGEIRTHPWVEGDWKFCPKCGKEIIAIQCDRCKKKLAKDEYEKTYGRCGKCIEKEMRN